MTRVAGLIMAAAITATALCVGTVSGASEPTASAVAPAGAAPAGAWTVQGEYRVSVRPTSLLNRSREPIVTAHPFDPSRLAVVFAAGPGEHSHPVIRISHDGGRTWRDTPGHPLGGGSHPMVAWGPGPRPGTARLYYTAMGGVPNDYHFEVSYSDNEGRTWHLAYVANHTRGWFDGIADMVVDMNPASPNYGVLYLAYNWPKDPARGDRPPRDRLRRLRPHVRRDRGAQDPRAGRLRRRLAHRLQARHRARRLRLRGGLPAGHAGLAHLGALL